MSADMTFVHLSDLHLLADPAALFFGLDPAVNVRRVLDYVASLPQKPAFYLISGDLSQDGQPASYARLREMLAPIEAAGTPVLVGMGNHDSRVGFRRGWLGQADADDEHERYYYSQMVGDLRIIMLDSLIPRAVPGDLNPAQLEWLAAELRQPAPAGTLVALHHPVAARLNRRPDDYLLKNARQLEEVLTGSDVLGVLSGHLHMSSVTHFAGVLAAVTPAVVFQFDPTTLAGERVTTGAGLTLGAVRDGHLLLHPMLLPGGGVELPPDF